MAASVSMLSLPAPAKLNLFLHVNGRRADGYHDIQTVFQFVNWCDTLDFEVLDRPEIRVSVMGSGAEILAQDNLVLRAAEALRRELGVVKGAHIHLKKVLPIGAGLGGGSSDAATTLLGLSSLWGRPILWERLEALGATLGADVPIFIRGHSAWGTGTGTTLTTLPPDFLPEPHYVLLIPPISVPTAALYQDPQLTRDTPPLTIEAYCSASSLSSLGGGRNDFEALVCDRYPLVRQARDWLAQFGVARMTGSGAVFFAAFDTREKARRIADQVPAPFRAVVTQGVNRSGLLKSFDAVSGASQ